MHRRVHDTRVFQIAGDFKFGQGRAFFSSNNMIISGVSLPTVILRDLDYPPLPWLMKLYPDMRAPVRRRFKVYTLSSCRTVVECGFGCLQTIWTSTPVMPFKLSRSAVHCMAYVRRGGVLSPGVSRRQCWFIGPLQATRKSQGLGPGLRGK